MTKGPEIVNLKPGQRVVMTDQSIVMANDVLHVNGIPTGTGAIHVTFTSDEQAYKYVNGVAFPESPDRGYNPDAFVVLRDVEGQGGR